ncbi:hypothetical protein HPB51_021337 [Rhipicephalus microplus]|uniref:VWFC domain-containing protein n=1 Tax=Rhipicephalus microplus TaxID=6941 RepID=A0A9J6F8T3_RHIMP|nr:hypothetical protein HPB51_021337 [Rhipicephalus microplus]
MLGPLGNATASRRHTLRQNEPYGERGSVPQMPVPRSHGYGVTIGNVQVPTTPRPPSCFYKSERYEHGDSVETTEPCLDCTCQKGVLVCYLRVCTTVGTPAPGCFTTKEAGQCCPSVFCSVTSTTASPFVSNEASADVRYVAETTSSNGLSAPVRKPLYDDEHGNSFEDALQGSGRDSIMFVSSTPIPFELHHSFDFQNLGTTSGACLDEASLYAEGSAMLSCNFCNYCYCIRGSKRCVQPKCHLAVEDCEPQFTSQYDCCPASYACSCWKKGKLYRVGELIHGTKDCMTCFCSPRGPLCQRIECPPVTLNCEPVIPQGHCCPTEYICNNTQVHENIGYYVDRDDRSVRHPQDLLEDNHRDTRPLQRESNDTLNYNSVPQVASTLSTKQETSLRASHVGTDKTTPAPHAELPSHTTSVVPVTRLAPTPIRRKEQPDVNGTTLPPLSLLYREPGTNDSTTKHFQQNYTANGFAQKLPLLDSMHRTPAATPQDGLQLSHLIGRALFPEKEEKKEAGDENLQTAPLSPVHIKTYIYNATSLGEPAIEARYPVKENGALQPMYKTMSAYQKATSEFIIGETGSLKPVHGKQISLREESSGELISQVHTKVSTTGEVHYKPAILLYMDSPSTNKSLVSATTKNTTVESSKPQTVPSYKDGTYHEERKRPHISIHPLELTPVYYNVRKYTTTRRPPTTPATAGSDAKLGTMTTTGTTRFVHRTSSAADSHTIFKETAPQRRLQNHWQARKQQRNQTTTSGN